MNRVLTWKQLADILTDAIAIRDGDATYTHLSVSTKEGFNQLLSARGARGNLTIFREKVSDIYVNTKDKVLTIHIKCKVQPSQYDPPHTHHYSFEVAKPAENPYYVSGND